MFALKKCPNCQRWNPRDSALCQYCGVSLGAYRICSRGHKNRWDAQHCGTCGDVFLTPALPPEIPWRGLGIGVGVVLIAVFVSLTEWDRVTTAFGSLISSVLATILFWGLLFYAVTIPVPRWRGRMLRSLGTLLRSFFHFSRQ